MNYAACRDMAPTRDEEDIFFPGPGRSDLSDRAKKICGGCPVIQECADWKKRCGARHGVFAGEIRDRGKSK